MQPLTILGIALVVILCGQFIEVEVFRYVLKWQGLPKVPTGRLHLTVLVCNFATLGWIVAFYALGPLLSNWLFAVMQMPNSGYRGGEDFLFALLGRSSLEKMALLGLHMASFTMAIRYFIYPQSALEVPNLDQANNGFPTVQPALPVSISFFIAIIVCGVSIAITCICAAILILLLVAYVAASPF